MRGATVGHVPSLAAPWPASAQASQAEAVSSATQVRSPLNAETGESLWMSALQRMGQLDVDLGKQFVEINVRGRKLTVRFDAPLSVKRFQDETRAQALRGILRELTGTDVELCCVLEEAEQAAQPVSRQQAKWELHRDSVQHPLVQAAIQLFDGDVTKVQAPPTE